MVKKFYIETYGCQMNVADSEVVAAILTAAGFEHTTDKERSGCASVNYLFCTGKASNKG